MVNKIALNKKLINLHEEGANFEQVLSNCVDILIENGFATEEYRSQVIEREKECPTALQFEHLTVALAHGDPIGVISSAMVIARCDNQPQFGLMDNPSEFVPVDIVILLGVNNPNSHIKVLAKLINVLSDEKVCNSIKTSENIDDVCEMLESELLKEDNYNE